jgi:hypothetical protein
VADGHRRVGVQQQQRHRLADDLAAAQHHRPAARELDLVALQQLHDPRRRAGHEARALLDQQAHVRRMEAVDVLVRAHVVEHALRVHLLRQRQLHQDAVDLGAAVEGLTAASTSSVVALAGSRQVSWKRPSSSLRFVLLRT